MIEDKFYPIASSNSLARPVRKSDWRVKPTGEFRPPRAGEWFLSGATIEGYSTYVDLATPAHIGRLVRVKTITTVVEVEV